MVLPPTIYIGEIVPGAFTLQLELEANADTVQLAAALLTYSFRHLNVGQGFQIIYAVPRLLEPSIHLMARGVIRIPPEVTEVDDLILLGLTR